MTKNEREWRNQFIFGPLAEVRKGYPMENSLRCDCTMQYTSTKNNNHDDNCELWLEKNFWDMLVEWDPTRQTLVNVANSPWDSPEDYVWNGDTPVVSQETAAQRVAAERQAMQDAAADGAEYLCPLEDEAHQAIINGSEPDEHGFVALLDGSYADCEARVTYRRVMVDGTPTWDEEYWDFVVPEVFDSTPLECVCTPPKHFYCQVCEVTRESEDDVWGPWHKQDQTVQGYGYNSVKGTTWTSGSYTYSNACGHNFETFRLPGAQNRNIKISGVHTHGQDNTPDFGLYAASCWAPKCVATFIPWVDYGLPSCSFETAAEAIVEAWAKSNEGSTVEVGCMGGHGRTGTILAALAILSDDTMTPEQAILWVRKVHCSHAIESLKQEWWIEWFAGWHRGTLESVREMPVTVYANPNTNPNWKAAQSSADPKTADGLAGNKGVWCNNCKRIVWTFHNQDCPFEIARKEAGKVDPNADTVELAIDAAVLAFDPTLYEGKQSNLRETANARRRNAKRANRRAAAKRRAREAALDAHS